MEWLDDFELFLFDFDGLLVNTEFLHFTAYKRMCANRGFDLDWDFSRYIKTAHYSAEGLEKQIFDQFPKLKEKESNWKILYEEKKSNLMDIYREGPIPLMAGVEVLLSELQKRDKKRCVVTHSDSDLIEAIRDRNPVLQSIPHWITRRDYSHPKPHPECYIKAIQMFAKEGDRVIGFEDTPRGLSALMETKAKPVIITEMPYPELDDFVRRGASHYRSFEDMFGLSKV